MIEQQIVTIRSSAINYMCQLPDRELRLAGSKNTAEVMYDAFKSCFANFYAQYDNSSSAAHNSNTSINSDANAAVERNLIFKPDRDGLSLAYKYFTSTTLTVRLCGVAQMSVNFFIFI